MTKTRDLSDFLIEGGADLPLGKPHIVPGVLQPAVAGKDLSGTALGGSYVYGTAHTDGHKYYYTDIKGSKPIKDPRIGSHFGSQRHKFKSLQLLEQETASHGKNVYSLDGREWVRAVSGTSNWRMAYDNWGHFPKNDSNCAGAIIEIVGYFNDINFLNSTYSDRVNDVDLYVNGTISIDGSQTVGGVTTAGSPLGGRHVDASSLINEGATLSNSLGTTPKINTLKFEVKTGISKYVRLYGIELIAQDTTSTANRSKIQIPSQNVVSYGKKFNVFGTPHYDPFTTMSYGGSGTTLSNLQSLIDTDTSLGMDAWKAGTSNYHRPWNGGRIIKWVDSSGTIKTSVNMMPPNAQNIGTTASNAVSDAHVIAGTNDDTINFNTSAIDHSQAEVAKSFHYTEFGNGAANGGTGHANYADASMLDGTDDIAFCMDDGLTALAGDNVERTVRGTNQVLRIGGYSKIAYLTFIGTGASFIETYGWAGSDSSENVRAEKRVVQNLPFGTHIIEFKRESGDGNNNGHVKIDGISVLTDIQNILFREVAFYQPKRPPIPEDACVIADYMLMADFVQQTSYGQTNISKGVRVVNGTRDWFYDSSSSFSANTGFFLPQQGPAGFYSVATQGSGTGSAQLPFFGTTGAVQVQDSHLAWTLELNGTGITEVKGDAGSDNYQDLVLVNNSDKATLGLNTLKSNFITGGYHWAGGYVDSPIHTSSHYQPFETPYLHELVGGDRNMEQHNLVCSPDGKTWDQLTRDTSYQGDNVLQITDSDSGYDDDETIIFDDIRGTVGNRAMYNKNFFAIAYDRQICLVSGQYLISPSTIGKTASASAHLARIYVNGVHVISGYNTSSGHSSVTNQIELYLNRGDYIQIKGSWHANHTVSNYRIYKRRTN